MKNNNIVEGPPSEYPLGDATLGEVTLKILKEQGNRVAQIDASTKEQLTINLLLNRAILLARWFDTVGIKTGDAVSICSENRLESVSIPLAAFFNGIIFAPVNPDYTARELEHCLNLSKPKVIFCSSGTFTNIQQFSADYPYVKYIVNFDNQLPKPANVISFTDIVHNANDNPVDDNFTCKHVDAKETIATILCSSGTTGLPKGVMCTHFNMLTWMLIGLQIYGTPNDGRNKIAVGVIPVFHSMGFMTMFIYLLSGTKFIVLRRFNPKMFLESIQTYKVNILSVPPPILSFISKSPMAKKYDLSSLKVLICGAAPLARELEAHTAKSFKLERFSQGYGLTETTFGILVNPPGTVKVGSVGCLVPGMQAKITDEKGNLLGPYQEGELCLKGTLIMKGYIGDPKATHTTVDEDGWLHSGDIAYYDEDSFFYIVDRKKELIKYKAYQVAPAELEALLLTHPDIVDSAVIGLPDVEAGELPTAFVVRRPNSKITAKEIEDYIAERVTNYKKLRGGVNFLKEVPRNSSGKILRRVLREQAAKMKSKL